jgi:hypothetical protein
VPAIVPKGIGLMRPIGPVLGCMGVFPCIAQMLVGVILRGEHMVLEYV